MSTPRIFCAIDTADLDKALALSQAVGPVTGGLKLGLEFFNSFGPAGVEKIRNACPEASIFLDLKLHDIPNTVAGAVRTLSENLAPAYLNIHASGGSAMMQAALEACSANTKLLAVTILSSLSKVEISDVGYENDDVDVTVSRLAALTKDAGLAGVVCSGHEIETLRNSCGPDFVLMVPGIRPENADADDQRRVMTPKRAIDLGATHLVIGRPITKAADPARAAQAILDEISA